MSFVPEPDIPPFSEFHDQAKAAYRSQGHWTDKLRFILPVVFALIGLFIGLGSALTIILGLVLGAGLGIGIALLVEHLIISSRAGELYINEWCQKTGWEYQERGALPGGHPLEGQGDEQDIGHGLAFEVDGDRGGVVNLDVITRTRDSDGNTDTDTDRYVVAWLEMKMPIRSIELSKRNFLDNRLFDSMDTKFSSQRVLELESVQFHKEFKLQVADDADDTMLRMVFTPKVIDAFVQGVLPLEAAIIYRHGRLWHVTKNEKVDLNNLGPDLHKALDPLDDSRVLLKKMFARVMKNA